MRRFLSPVAIANARVQIARHGRQPDGTCKCGKEHGQVCRQARAYAFNALKLEGVELIEASA